MRRLLLLLIVLLAVPAAAQAAPGRISIAVVGDSIVESSHLAAPDRDGLAAQLRRQIERRGFDPGAAAFVSTHPGEPVRVLAPLIGQGSWRYAGDWSWVTRWPGAPADLFSWTSAPGATATLQARDADSASVLYLSGPVFGRFAFRAGAQRLEVDANAATAGFGIRTLALAATAEPQQLDITGAVQGGIGLVGVFLRRAPRPGHTQLELTTIARGGAQAADASTPLEDAGLAYLRPRVTLLMMGTNDGIGYAATRDPAALARLRDGLATRGRRARATGACVVVPPGRDRFPADVYAAVQAAVADAAAASDCALVPALDALDGHPQLTIDGIHPSTAGYRELAAALAPRLIRLAVR